MAAVMLLFSANREQLWYIKIIISNMAFGLLVVMSDDDGGGTYVSRHCTYKYVGYFAASYAG
jgi:hypothetical protein